MTVATFALFTGPAAAADASVALLDAPDFAWNIVCDPVAVHHDGTTYVVGIRDDGLVRVMAFDHATRTSGTPVTVASGLVSPSGSVHHSAAICRRTDGHLVVALCQEGSTAVHVRISSAPDDVSAWGPVIDAGAGGNYTYVSLYQLPDVVGAPLYIFTRPIVVGGFRLGYAKSTDGGATWSAFTNILATAVNGPMYWRLGTDGSSVLHVFVTDTDRLDANPSSIHHFRFVGDALQASDGSAISGSLPVQVTAGTLVQDASFNSARPEGWAMYQGRPALLAKCSELDRDPTVLRVCVWDGEVWVNTTVVTTSGPTTNSGMRKDDPYAVYLAVLTGDDYEMYRYRSYDEGASWRVIPLGHGSGLVNGSPDTPLGAADGLRVMWLRGTGLGAAGWSYGLTGSNA